MELCFSPSLSLHTRRICRPLLSTRPLRRLRTCISPPSRFYMSGRPRLITTPLYYVNAAPHMGSAYPTIAADALARFYRMTPSPPVFITGCDEHGEKIAAAAAKAAVSDVQLFCDRISERFKDLWTKLDIRYDAFIRTTSPNHAVFVKTFLERVWEKGDIYKADYEGLYCTGCEEYKDKKDLINENICPTHQTECSNRKESNYFFALSNYQTQLEAFLEQNPDFVQPVERRNEVLKWVRSGLRDFSISRANNKWGIPITRDNSQTIYVWFDALLGYISPLLEDGEGIDQVLEKGWPADVHIIGKDILRFHAVYWPAMLMSAGLPLPKRVIGHGFITKDGMKMGKSLGNTLDPFELVDTYGSDAVRYYFLKGLDFGKDGDFQEQRFVDIVNADLANSLGNLLNRSLNLLKKNCGGILPVSAAELGGSDASHEEQMLKRNASVAVSKAFEEYEKLDFNTACESMMSIAYEANAYIDRVAPWTKFKSDNEQDVEEARRCIVLMLEVSRIVAVGLSPVTPQLAKKIHDALGLGDDFENGLKWDETTQWGLLAKDSAFAKPKPVFPRLEAVAQKPAVAVSY